MEFKVIEGDGVNCILNAALRTLSGEELISLRDQLISKTPPIARTYCLFIGQEGGHDVEYMVDDCTDQDEAEAQVEIVYPDFKWHTVKTYILD